MPWNTQCRLSSTASLATDHFPHLTTYILIRGSLPRVPESLLKKRKTQEKIAVERAAKAIEDKKVRSRNTCLT